MKIFGNYESSCVVSSREHLLVLGSGITGLSLKKTPHVWLPHAKKTFYCYNVRF